MQSYFSLFILLLIGFLLFSIGVFIPVWFLMTSDHMARPYVVQEQEYEYSPEKEVVPSTQPVQTREDVDAVLKEIDATDLNALDTVLKENDRDAATF